MKTIKHTDKEKRLISKAFDAIILKSKSDGGYILEPEQPNDADFLASLGLSLHTGNRNQMIRIHPTYELKYT